MTGAGKAAPERVVRVRDCLPRGGGGGVVALALAALILAVTGDCSRLRYDVPGQLLKAPGVSSWGTGVRGSGPRARLLSVTNLNGRAPLEGKPHAVLERGSHEGWMWTVRAAPRLQSSWKVWNDHDELDGRPVRELRASPDSWEHAAADWNQAFVRTWKVASYLLGENPPELAATLILLPPNTRYHSTLASRGLIPTQLTFGFYYPESEAETHALNIERFTAMMNSVSTMFYEYQHALTAGHRVGQVGDTGTAREINDEARSVCWQISDRLAITAGTHTTTDWQQMLKLGAYPALLGGVGVGVAISGASRGPGKKEARGGRAPKFEDALLLGQYLAAKSISDYLVRQGKNGFRVSSHDPDSMNDVLSVCRAMTRQPLDLTKAPYPAGRVEHLSFFPARRRRK